MEPNISMPKTKVYNIYVATITQAGDSDPTAVILQNNLIGEIAWTRDSAGTYYGTLPGGFGTDENKLFSIITSNGISRIYWVDEDTVELNTRLGNGTLSDSILAVTPIEIRIYN